MPRPAGTRRLLALDTGRTAVSRDVDREIRTHIELHIDDLIDGGMSPTEAREAALRAFGDRGAIAAECRTVRLRRRRDHARTRFMHGIGQDLRFAARSLRRAPAFTVVALLTLALGVGANTAIFSALDAVLLRPMPFADADRLVSVELMDRQSVSKATLERVRERQRAFESVAAYSRWGFPLTGVDEPEALDGAIGTANLFSVLGARAALGRTFLPDEDQPGRAPVVVLSDGLWRRRFAADPSIVGRAITMGGVARTVVGVMPNGFEFPAHGTQAWIPATIDRADTNDYIVGYLLMVARLRPGQSVQVAGTHMRAIARDLRGAFPREYDDTFGSTTVVEPLRNALVGEPRRLLLMLFGAVGFVLLIACVNVANLLLARATGRAREIAVRASLGAARARIVRQLLTESILIAVLGGAAGLALAWWLGRFIGAMLPADLPRAGDIVLDGRVLAFAGVLTLIVGIGFGLVPAIRASRGNLFLTLREGGRGASAGGRTRRTMATLVVVELALALVLAVGALLTLQSFWRLRNQDPGFRAEGVLAMSLEPPAADSVPEMQRAFNDGVIERLEALPGVISVGAVHLLPLRGGNWNPQLVIEGRPHTAGQPRPEVDWRVATPGYFRTMRIPLLRGRVFDATDRDGGVSVGVVNAALVQRDFPGEEPIGKRVYTFFEGRGNWVTIIGVVGDMKDQSLAARARPQLYRPLAQRAVGGMTMMIRTTGEPSAIASAARSAVWSVERDVPIADLRPLEDVVDASVASARLTMLLLALFGILAVTLGAVGIYGVMAYGVTQRMHEIGVRVALGATGREVGRLILLESLRLTAVGLALGTVAALALTRLLATQLHEVRPTDPPTFVSVAVGLGLITLLASWIPARRAMRVDPLVALR